MATGPLWAFRHPGLPSLGRGRGRVVNAVVKKGGFIDGTVMDFSGFYGDLPSGYVKIAIENGPFIVDFPIENGDFPLLC